MSDYPMLISNKLHSFRNFMLQNYKIIISLHTIVRSFCYLCRTVVLPMQGSSRSFSETIKNKIL